MEISMNKITTKIFILGLLVLCIARSAGASDTKNQMKTRYYSVNPTVIILLREETKLESFEDWVEVINAALPESERSKDLSKLGVWEIIVILDEGDHWAVSFHEKGNGMLSREQNQVGLEWWDLSPKDGDGVVFYLSKGDLQVVKEVSENPIDKAPMPWKVQ